MAHPIEHPQDVNTSVLECLAEYSGSANIHVNDTLSQIFRGRHEQFCLAMLALTVRFQEGFLDIIEDSTVGDLIDEVHASVEWRWQDAQPISAA